MKEAKKARKRARKAKAAAALWKAKFDGLVEKVDKAHDIARDLEKRLCLAEADAKMAREREQGARTTAALWQAKSDALVEVLLKHGVPSGACFLPIRAADDLLTDLETKLAAALARAEAAEARLATAASADLVTSVADVEEASRVETTGAVNMYVRHFRAESDKLRADEK